MRLLVCDCLAYALGVFLKATSFILEKSRCGGKLYIEFQIDVQKFNLKFTFQLMKKSQENLHTSEN